MLRAFNYMFKDNMFRGKYISYYLCVFAYLFLTQLQNIFKITRPSLEQIGISLLIAIISVFVFMLMMGYQMNSINALTKQEGNFILPFFNFKKVLVKGAKYWAAIFLFSTAIALFLSITGIINGILAGIFASKVLLISLFSICALIVLTVFVFYTLPFNWIYANSDNIFSFFKFKTATQLMMKDKKRYFSYLGMAIVTIILGTITTFVTTVVLGDSKNILFMAIACVVNALVSTYFGFVNMFLTANAIEEN